MTWVKFTLVIGLTIALLAMQTPRYSAPMAEGGAAEGKSVLAENLARTFGFRRVLRTADQTRDGTAGEQAGGDVRSHGFLGPFFKEPFPDPI